MHSWVGSWKLFQELETSVSKSPTEPSTSLPTELLGPIQPRLASRVSRLSWFSTTRLSNASGDAAQALLAARRESKGPHRRPGLGVRAPGIRHLRNHIAEFLKTRWTGYFTAPGRAIPMPGPCAGASWPLGQIISATITAQTMSKPIGTSMVVPRLSTFRATSSFPCLSTRRLRCHPRHRRRLRQSTSPDSSRSPCTKRLSRPK